MKKRKPNHPTRVDAVRHRDKRKNIPTEELRDFVREDEQQPGKVLYPRDPDLDPQLVCRFAFDPRLSEDAKRYAKLTVTIRALDVYDPTTGEIRSSGTDDIACWSIDTNYDRQGFFARHACFTGAEQPYEKLKRAVQGGGWRGLAGRSRAGPRPGGRGFGDVGEGDGVVGRAGGR